MTTARFPTSVWGGTTRTRLRVDDYRGPDAEDAEQIIKEIIALETHLLELKDADKIVTLAPSVAANTDPVYTKINDAFNIVTKDIVLAIGASAVASKDLGYNIPTASLLIGVAFKVITEITLATATKIGFGVAGDLDKYGIITGGAVDAAYKGVFATVLTAAEDVKVYACDNNGDAAGTIADGSIRVRLTFLQQNDI